MNKVNAFFAPVFLILSVILTFFIIHMEKNFDTYRLETDVIVQQLEFERQVYLEEVEKLRYENFVLYDEMRQVRANREAQLILDKE